MTTKDSATWLWARSILQHSKRSTIFLILFAGLAAAAAMTAWEFSRRASTVIERRLDFVLPADGFLGTCPPGADPSVDITPCFDIVHNEFAYRALIESPAVAAASLSASSHLAVSATRNSPPIVTFGAATVDRVDQVGAPAIVSGDAVDDDVADAVVLAESIARPLGVGAGSTVWVAGCALNFFEPGSECGEPIEVRVAGITRTDRDLLPARRLLAGSTEDDTEFGVFGGIAWYQSFTKDYPAFSQTLFRLVPGATFDDVRADVVARLPEGWTVLVSQTEDETTINGLRQSTRLQAGALLVIAVILAVAGGVFVAQALIRQTRRDIADRVIAISLGMTRHDLTRVALMRSVPIAVASAAIAVFAAAAASSFGPTGLAGRAEVEPGFRIDLTVLTLGAVATLMFVVGVCVLVSIRSAPSTRRRSPVGWPASLTSYAPATALAGFALGRSPRTGGGRTVVLSTAVAIVAIVGAGVLVDGIDAVTAEPREFGASWQYSFGAFVSGPTMVDATEQLNADPFLTDVALVHGSGPVQVESVSSVWVVSFTTLKGDLGPIIIEGRAPIADDEVAVGVSTLDSLGKEIGDELEPISPLANVETGTEVAVATDTSSSAGTTGPLTIVGVALISDDSFAVGPGNAILVTESARRLIDPAVSPVVVVRTDARFSDSETVRHLLDTYGLVTVPSPQSDLANLLLISDTPWIVAFLIAVLAAGALGHSLISVVRRGRREFGVLRALGFTRRQVSASVSWHATRVAAVAIAIGIPAGIIAGRWAWSTLADSVGLGLDPVVKPAVPLLAALAMLLAANLVAAVPARRAHEHNLADSLRDVG